MRKRNVNNISVMVSSFLSTIPCYLSNETAAGGFALGAPERNRTSDLRLRKPLLYPLSYRCMMKKTDMRHRV